MASKRQKKERAKSLIGDIVPSVPPVGPLALPGRALRLAEALAKELVERDPLGIITSDEAIMTIVNDDNITLTPKEVELINDPQVRMMPNGEVVRRVSGREQIRRSGQFSRSALLPDLPQTKPRRKTNYQRTYKTKFDKVQKKYKKKDGTWMKNGFKKAVKEAHRLTKKALK